MVTDSTSPPPHGNDVSGRPGLDANPLSQPPPPPPHGNDLSGRPGLDANPLSQPPPPPPPPPAAASVSAISPSAVQTPAGSPTNALAHDQALPHPQGATPIERALFQVKRVVVGQHRMVERVLACLIAQGHCLLEGVPGIAKTLTVETLAKVVGGSFVRLQFTPDMLPADIVGTRIWRSSSETFDIELGPIMANMVLVDEINRAPAKVQSALLEAMAERQVSIGGQTFELPKPFLVLATQNPIESDGVYPLPEAQRDRFLMKIIIDYPTPSEEVEIVQRMSFNPPQAAQVLTLQDLLELQQLALETYLDRNVIDYAVSLTLATRDPAAFGLAELSPMIAYGASPRSSLGLVSAAKALAVIRNRNYVLPQDVYDVAPEVMRHRLVLSYEALARDVTSDHVVAEILTTVPAPQIAPSQSPTYGSQLPSKTVGPPDHSPSS